MFVCAVGRGHVLEHLGRESNTARSPESEKKGQNGCSVVKVSGQAAVWRAPVWRAWKPREEVNSTR